MNEDQFFKFIYDLAKKHGSKFPELVAGQASLESAYGKKKPNQFNVFGQTATSSQPHNVVNNRKWRNYGRKETVGIFEREWCWWNLGSNI